MIFDILGQLATWLTLIIVYLTLREMGEQRKSSQKPELIIQKLYFTGLYTGEENKKLIYPTEWREPSEQKTASEKEETHEAISKFHPFPSLKIYNIGFGAAKNIELKWTIKNTEQVADRINKYSKENSIPIVVQSYSNSLRAEIEGKEIPLFEEPRLVNIVKHDYLLPLSVNSSELNTNIPKVFSEVLFPILICLELFEIQKKYEKLRKNNKKNIKDREGFLDILSIKLELSYKDVGGAMYTKTFDVGLEMLGFGVPTRIAAFRTPISASYIDFTENPETRFPS
jgi:hypothetical protein